MEFFDLSGKVAIITGGNRGIGFAIAKGLATAGAAVVIANRTVEEGQRAADALKAQGLQAMAVQADVSDKSSVDHLVKTVMDECNQIDILVNSAGVIQRGPVEDFTEEQWDYIININLKGLFFCCQLVGKEMINGQRDD
jgi:NAD(P)-dependent dehydrogenase (short-subunit alcohol dehydrogenase family)